MVSGQEERFEIGAVGSCRGLKLTTDHRPLINMADKEMEILNDRDMNLDEEVIGDRPKRYQRRRARQVIPDYVDWKDIDLLRQFVPERGKIMPRRISGITAKDQRRISQAIKRARSMAMLPFVAD